MSDHDTAQWADFLAHWVDYNHGKGESDRAWEEFVSNGGVIPTPTASRPRACKDCRFWKKDYGLWCSNGWSGMDRDDGHCHVVPVKIYRKGQDIACAKGEQP